MGTAPYLAVWNGLARISDEEATHQYQLLREVESAPRSFDAEVHALYSRLCSLYPQIDTLPEVGLDDSRLGLQHGNIRQSCDHGHPVRKMRQGRPAGSDTRRREWASGFRSPGAAGLNCLYTWRRNKATLPRPRP